MKLFPWRTGAKRAVPRAEQSTAFVDVTPSERRRGVTPGPAVYPADRPLDPDLTGCDVAHVRAHLPNATPAADLDLRAARAVIVMRQHSAFLADTSGVVEPPSREALIEAQSDAVAFIHDRLVNA